MQRTPIFIYVITLVGLILGVWMVAEGLAFRFTGEFLTQDALWARLVTEAGFEISGLPFVLVWLGSTWFGALCALWVRSTWAYNAALAVSLLSMLFLGPGTILAALAFVGILNKQTRKWISDDRQQKTVSG